MTREEMKARTKAYAVRIVKLVQSLPRNRECDVLGSQLLRAGTSVGANYRAVCRAKSTADFINKLRIVEEECDESLYWIEVLVELGLAKPHLIARLRKEADEIIAIVVSSIKTARRNTNFQK